MLAVQRAPLRRAFLSGLVTGVVYFTGTLYWIAQVMAVYGGLPTVAAVLINGLLIAYLALFPAAFAVILARLSFAFGPRSLAIAPLAWVATELGRSYFLTGFPWVLLGYSQASVPAVAQFASVLGVFGLSGLVASVSAGLAYSAAVQVSRRDVSRSPGLRAYAPLGLVMVVVLLVGAWGSRRIARGEFTSAGDRVTVGLVQGNVDQGDKWDASRASAIFRDYLSMTRQAIGAGAQVVVWPESSTPFFFQEDRPGAEQVRSIAREAKVPILLGSDQMEHTTPPVYYNAAFMVGPDGEDRGVYRKMHLVPFGEYVPLKRLLFFAAPLVEAVSDFTPGDALTLLPLRNHFLSTAICYEIVYPDLVRRSVNAGSELLTTITNDAWFGASSAPYQHFEQASMRAVENGRYLVRAANTGISGIVDPYGRIVERTGIFQPAVVVGEARFLRVRTVYSRIGDVFAYASAACTIAALLLVRRRVR